MTINWYGHSCFKITNAGGQLVIFTDPFDKKIGLNPPRGNADLILVSHDHEDHNNVKALSGEPFVINSPGEYGVKGINIVGVYGFHDAEEKELITIYTIVIDKIKICHLSDLGQNRLTDKQVEKIGSVDILLIPVGNKGHTIGASQAVKIIEQIGPQIVIPMHYNLSGVKVDLDGVDKFLKEMGQEEKEAVNKLTLKKKDLIDGKTEVIIMKQ